MKNRITLPFLFAALAFISLLTLLHCQSAEPEAKITCSTNVNPNGDSELALLMREMADSAASVREKLLSGQDPGPFPEHFLKLPTAEPTRPDKKEGPAFPTFTDSYLKALRGLHEGPAESRKEQYELLIQACVNCHNNYCPGPLMRIEKLTL